MGKLLFTKKFSLLLASTLIFSVLFTAIVYACSGLDQVRMAFHHSSMNGGTMVERGPCSEHKQDLCKSVRYRILSIQASATRVENSLQVLTIPPESSVHVPMPFAVSLGSLPLRTVFHPVFKLSLPFTYLVLRI
jgi:hypothetical protein